MLVLVVVVSPGLRGLIILRRWLAGCDSPGACGASVMRPELRCCDAEACALRGGSVKILFLRGVLESCAVAGAVSGVVVSAESSRVCGGLDEGG